MSLLNISKLITLDRHIETEEEQHPEATGDLTLLLQDLTLAIRLISNEVRHAGLNGILGSTTNRNIHGETVKKLDDYANQIIINAMEQGGHTAALISEEAEKVIFTKNKKKSKYFLAFDPLDGSTNIDVYGTIGTIFSINKIRNAEKNDITEKDVLIPGSMQVAAGYVLYGSSTVLVYTTGNGVNVFTYDHLIGEFLLTFEKIRIPDFGYYYSCNEGNSLKWTEKVQEYICNLKQPIWNDSAFTLRYIASVVADIHRTIHYGGIYLYPADTKQKNGKLRLIYEANPLAMIVEQAGGIAVDGKQRILDIVPQDIHQKVPFFAGSKGNIKQLQKIAFS